MTTTLIGIAAGEARGAGRVSLVVAADGRTATLGDRRIALTGQMLVIWHASDRGTWHGVKDPASLRATKAREATGLVAGEGFRGVEESTSSGLGDAAALVAVVDRPLAIVTSGYRGRRDWMIRVFEPDGDGLKETFNGDPVAYRAQFAPAEVL